MQKAKARHHTFQRARRKSRIRHALNAEGAAVIQASGSDHGDPCWFTGNRRPGRCGQEQQSAGAAGLRNARHQYLDGAAVHVAEKIPAEHQIEAHRALIAESIRDGGGDILAVAVFPLLARLDEEAIQIFNVIRACASGKERYVGIRRRAKIQDPGLAGSQEALRENADAGRVEVQVRRAFFDEDVTGRGLCPSRRRRTPRRCSLSPRT